MAGGIAFQRREGARNVGGQGADHFGEHGEGPEEKCLNGRSRIFRRSGGGIGVRNDGGQGQTISENI